MCDLINHMRFSDISLSYLLLSLLNNPLNKPCSDLPHCGKHINSPWLCACVCWLWAIWQQLLESWISPIMCSCQIPVFSCTFNSHSSPVFFISQQTSNVSATLVLSRPIKGPREVVLDLEMVTVNNVINFRGSSIIRLTIFVSEHPFWASQMNCIAPKESSCTHLRLM